MREIKFKAKRLDGGEWVSGSLVGNGQTSWISLGFTTAGTHGCPPYEVDPETVCEFTGLKDKNGVEIYEGDRIGWHDTLEEDLDDHVVVRFAQNGYTSGFYFGHAPNIKYCQRFGNIHDEKEEG